MLKENGLGRLSSAEGYSKKLIVLPLKHHKYKINGN